MDANLDPRASDAAVLDRFRRGDPRAFDDIVRAYGPEIYRIALRILGSHQDADEAAQETFLRAWRGLPGFRGDSSLRTWMVRIVVNVARTAAGRRRETVALEEAGPAHDPRPSAEEAVGTEEVRERVRVAVAALPPRQREVVLLKVFTDLTYREVAAVMEISEGAAKAHLHQAIRNLRGRIVDPLVKES